MKKPIISFAEFSIACVLPSIRASDRYVRPEVSDEEWKLVDAYYAEKNVPPEEVDRDTNFSSAFRTTPKNTGVESVRLPAKIPNLNSHLERFHLSIKSECLSRMIFFPRSPCVGL